MFGGLSFILKWTVQSFLYLSIVDLLIDEILLVDFFIARNNLVVKYFNLIEVHN